LEVILDNNAVSAFADANAAVLRQLRPSAGVHLPVIVLGEYRYGVKSSRQRAAREKWDEPLARENLKKLLNGENEEERLYYAAKILR
jgi:tRNA(fMet)-specific endonuclease VapC